ncbi:MAG: FAD-dependent protein [Bacteroidota bacterium]
MGYKEIDLKLPTDFDDQFLRNKIGKELRIKNFRFRILNKSLDARKSSFIHWQTRVGVVSDEIKGGIQDKEPELVIPRGRHGKKAIVLGSGPAGFFAAFILQRAGFMTTILERGAEVEKRDRGILQFEKSGVFDPVCNYAFGEGGAGTFSDGKLTSRSKHISAEKKYILDSYIRAGAPAEIGYLTHPHVGSDNLKIIVKNLRRDFIHMGGTILFETMLEDLVVQDGKVTAAVTSAGVMDASVFVLAPGHSSYETYRMLINRGVPFRTKNFALGFRAEHPQEIINRGQWGRAELPGVKAAEYRLTSNRDGRLPVFTFCMCPGGMVVPATAYATANIVNGMSMYLRDGQFANAACVAGIHPDQLAGRETSAMDALDLLQQLEEQFFQYSQSYQAPFVTISDFLKRRVSRKAPETSYPLGLIPAPLWEMIPEVVVSSIAEGLQDFSRKLKGYDEGILLGLESKTSAPVQVIRDETGRCEGFSNLYLAGEGSGYAGGIISSGADGIRVAMRIAELG